MSRNIRDFSEVTSRATVRGHCVTSCRNGFTLAEVLITLGIIGVVAAMTMPVLVGKYKERVLVTSLKKNYLILSQAINYAEEEYGDFRYWDVKDNNVDSVTECFNKIKPHIKILRNCQYKAGCWTKDKTKNLDGNDARDTGNGGIGTYYYSFTTVDGSNIILDIWSLDTNTLGVKDRVKNGNTQVLVFVVDVNGDKPPNQIGIDTFYFVQQTGALIPAGADNNSENCRKGAGILSGYTCAAKVLYEGKMSYL